VGADQWVVHNCAAPEPDYVPARGTLRDNGYQYDEHFVSAFKDEKGLSYQDVVRILQNGSAYTRVGDIPGYISITGQTYNGRTFTVIYNSNAGQLYTIFSRGVASTEFEYVQNPFDIEPKP
jgi:hypothetical protein